MTDDDAIHSQTSYRLTKRTQILGHCPTFAVNLQTSRVFVQMQSLKASVVVGTKPKQSLVSIELVRLLAYEGDRIFTTDRARKLAPRVGLKDTYLVEALYHLRRNNWIVPLRRGLYALSSMVLGVATAHEFEVAVALVSPAMISHWSALHYHGLTKQIPRDVFVLTTTDAWIPRLRKDRAKRRRPGSGFLVGDTLYRFTQVKPDRFFGGRQQWVGEVRVPITDLERTLLDGLSMPQYCGDFAEVLHAVQVGMDRLNIELISEYAVRLGVTTAKRLGWVLESQGVPRSELAVLAELPIKGYCKLNPTGPRKGSCNSRWMVQENLPGMVEA